MITTVTQKNMVAIPAAVGRRFGIKPGLRRDWEPVGDKSDEMHLPIIPDRGTLARRLLGAGSWLAPGRDTGAGLVAARQTEA